MFDPDLLREIDRIVEQYKRIHDEIERIWVQQIVFTWHWWVDLALAVLPWVLWIIVRDRKNTHRLLYAGLFTAFVATLLDFFGVTQGGWGYNTLLFPFMPDYLPWDWTIMPVVSMLFYQFWPKVKPWIKGAAFSIIASYVVEPIFTWLGFYEPVAWEHYFSLPIYFVIYMTGYWLYTRRFGEPVLRKAA